MKYRRIVPVLFVAGMLSISELKDANAYFTTYVTAKGGYDLTWHKETIKEEFGDWTKVITISSETDSIPVYVRARAFAGSTYSLTYEGEQWTQRQDGYFYYQNALYGGKTTDELKVKIDKVPLRPDEGANFNVIVIYETVPAQYGEDGKMIAPDAADWSKILTSKMEKYEGDVKNE